MKIGDLVKVDVFPAIKLAGIIISIKKQSRPLYGYVENINSYVYEVLFLGENMPTSVFEDEILEVISESR